MRESFKQGLPLDSASGTQNPVLNASIKGSEKGRRVESLESQETIQNEHLKHSFRASEKTVTTIPHQNLDPNIAHSTQLLQLTRFEAESPLKHLDESPPRKQEPGPEVGKELDT